MSKKPATKPTTLGELQPGDTCVLPRSTPVTAHAVRVVVTGRLDCGVLYRHVDSKDCCDGDGEPHVAPAGCSVSGVQRRRSATAASKGANVDPLLGWRAP
jgi:hypothetical protein